MIIFSFSREKFLNFLYPLVGRFEKMERNEEMIFSSSNKVYFATKYGTLKKRNDLLYNTSEKIIKEEEIETKKIQIVIPRGYGKEKKEKLPSINSKKTQYGRHNSFNLRIWGYEK